MQEKFGEQFEPQDEEREPQNSAGEGAEVEGPSVDNAVGPREQEEPESEEETQQTPEQIRELLESALNEGFKVNLTIEDSGVRGDYVKGLYVDDIDGDYLMLTYDNGEGIPLEIQRVKGAYRW